MMEYRDGMFQETLGEFAFYYIKRAFIEHIKTSPDLPTPSDIITLTKKFMELPRQEVTVEMLARYKSKGIRLTPAQEEKLAQHEKIA